IGIEKIAEEFADKSTSAKAVDFVFKWIGLQWMDRLGKETQINAAFDKYSKLAEQEPDSKSKKIVGYRVGDNTGQAGAGTFYSLNPTNINSALPNKSTDVKKQNLEFDNLLEISESELFGYKGNPSEYLANKWLKSNFDVLEEGSLMDKAVAEEAVKRGYDGIKYGNLEIQDLRSLRPVGKKSSEKNSKFKKQMEDIFGDEASQVIADLKAKTPSDNVKFLLFSELADVQPIAMSEMPEQYLKGGNGRILYMLKTYTIKQIDVFRNECFIDMADRKREALGRFIRLASMLILANATADILKDLLLGRPLESDDEDYAWVKLTDNIIRLFGLTKYSLYRFKKDGVSEGVSSIVLPPVFNFVTRGAKDIDKAIKDDGDFEPHQTEIIQSVPMLGKLYYWWFGGGRKKIEDEE
ncbi:MAG TPA: hypothetical protein VD998_01135, partial [Verrucomicrobiae bacterium]|nr:hypothetical protein [Verrucomicrobiae bacterium]